MNGERSTSQSKTFGDYIATSPEQVQRKLTELRSAIKEAAPEAEESISYGMPTFKLNGNVAHFAAYKKHIGFYVPSSVIAAFKEELSGYKQLKGTVQFPLNEPLPSDTVKDIVRFRVKENLAHGEKRAK